MNRMLTAIMAVAVAVTFSAPAFASDKDEEKEGGKVIQTTYEAQKEKKDKKKGDN